MEVSFVAAFLAGILSFASPCVLPLVPVMLSYIGGVSYDDVAHGRRRRLLLTHAAFYILGFSLVFIVLGMTASALGKTLESYAHLLEIAGGALLIVLGAWMLKLVRLDFLYKDTRKSFRDKPAGYLGSILVGAAFGAGWTPCVGPILSAILYLAAETASVGQGAALLAVYSLGMGLPLFLCALGAERAFAWIKRSGPVLVHLERAFGGVLLVFGGLLISGWWNRLIGWVLSSTSGWAMKLNGIVSLIAPAH